ncbi:four-carbon acid sugar kinase family protein [Cohnella thailandensis]|uniref:Four-carbon acid sugar kinase family protein n=1 Tax=Cohnella thailandensis TaxID=557557 RepID=A0A841T3V2_9BACL|nr:four-carbon acid sugar kinase family protein [Cohnella thailandensis]MBB6637315.1 four-carbon acid sugar kinase family protein [Cohnella thailandensis]MBP1976643.1 uncharacterized protein YgbK (DUF1537 family) [Cohnella thailandensis]
MGRPLLMAFYGDDFTGSTDAMEVLEGQGLRTVLFIRPPTKEWLETFSNLPCIGVAGTARAMSPEAMESELAPVLEQLKLLGPKILHYKMCSTADSSPDIGSIGKVVEIGKRLYPDQGAVPVLVAAPHLRRYTAFGNHFADYRGDVYRLDRHPSMSRHPVTPMKEADLLVHFAEQTSGTLSLYSVTDLEQSLDRRQTRWADLLGSEKNAVLMDALNEEHIRSIGELVGSSAEHASLFVVGSSGFSQAFGSYWRDRHGIEKRAEPELERMQTLVLSGSCSPLTDIQIRTGVENGFVKIKADVMALLNERDNEGACDRLLEEASRAWQEGRSLILYTAEGSDDVSIGVLHDEMRRRGLSISNTGPIIGDRLGRIGKLLIRKLGIKRVVLAGGDTSGFASLSLGIEALELLQRTAPGAPLCRAHSRDSSIDGLQIALKGGQLGQPDYFVRVASGRKEAE